MTDEILWAGKPKQGLLLISRDALLIPFSLVWCGFAVFWTISATGHQGPSFFTLWGLMFVAIGLYFVFGRFIHDAANRGRISYTVTKSGIKITSQATETVIPAGEWACLEMVKHSDGSGTIRFAPHAGLFNGSNFSVWVPSMEKAPQFYRIEGPEQVLEIIRSLSK